MRAEVQRKLWLQFQLIYLMSMYILMHVILNLTLEMAHIRGVLSLDMVSHWRWPHHGGASHWRCPQLGDGLTMEVPHIGGVLILEKVLVLS
jgi:hypothetical protein